MFSEKFNAIFVHIPRTGGQSVEHVFTEMHGLTWKDRSPLLLGVNPVADQVPARLAHLFAREYVEQGFLARDRFEACLKFVTVRNPFDRMLSEFRYWSKKRHWTLQAFGKRLMKQTPDRHFAPQAHFVSDGSGITLVDKILRFETLQEDFIGISEQIFGRAVDLPHLNKSPALTQPVEFDSVLRKAIYKQYEADFDLFQYPGGHDYHYAPSVRPRDDVDRIAPQTRSDTSSAN